MKKFVYVLLAASLLAGCNVDQLEFDNLEVTPIQGPFVFPLGEANYVLRDLISNQTGDSLNLTEDSTSLYVLFYYDTITYNASDDLVQIPDIQNSGSLSSPNFIPVGTGPATVSSAYVLDGFAFDPSNGEELDSVFYETGDISITSSTNINGTVNYTFTFPSTTNLNTGNPLTITGTINGNGTTVQGTENASLAGYKTSFTDPSGANTYSVNLDLEIVLAAGQNTNGLENFDFDVSFSNQTFSLIYGKFGQDTVQVGNQTLEIDFFTQAAREGITFGNPILSFDFRNSFGVPIDIDFSGLSGDDGNGGNQVFLSGNIVNNRPRIEGSDVSTPTPTTPGETVQSVIEINRDNSNIIKLLGSSPDRLLFNVQAFSNADSQSELNYVHSSSQITAYVEVRVPMEVQLENYQETGTFSMRGGFDASNLDSAFIRLVSLNELPFTGTVNLEVQAEDSTVLFPITDESDPRYDSAVTNHPGQIERFTNIPVIKAPLINVNGVVTDPSGETTDVALTNEELQLLSGAARIVITMNLNTPVSQTSRDIYVKILADYTLQLKVGIGARFNLDF